MAGRSGEKTSFAIACGLLSQYVKDKGNSLNLNLGMGESYQRPTTMRFLPGADVEPETQIEENSTAFVSVSSSRNEMELFPQTAGFDATNTSQDKPAKQAEKSQLTIFYGGRVVVFDNYPADKVKELMSFASKGSSASGNSTCVPPTSPSSSQISATDQSTVPLPSAQVQAAPKPAQAKISDLPIMRKASLQRFLEKRKDRLNAKAPYQQQQVCTSKKESAAPKKENVEELWFGLGPKV